MKDQKLIRFDWAINTILRDKANFDVLEGFLSALLKEDIKVVQLLESESNQDTPRQKFNRVDIMVLDSNNKHMIIEIQNEHEADFLERLLFGTSVVIVDNLEIGQSFSEVKKVISISIQYFNLGRGEDYIYYGSTHFNGVHTKKPLVIKKRYSLTNKKFVFKDRNIEKEIFPEYYLINVERFKDEIISDIDEWIYMLKNETIPNNFKSKNIDKAREKLKLAQMSDPEKKAYEKYIINTVRDIDMIQTARDEGLEKGLKKGLKKGEIKGMIQMLLLNLKTRLGQLSENIEQQIRAISDTETITELFKLSCTCNDENQFLSLMNNIAVKNSVNSDQ
jgi:predicted transposase/invertase (TIGR01784 family)